MICGENKFIKSEFELESVLQNLQYLYWRIFIVARSGPIVLCCYIGHFLRLYTKTLLNSAQGKKAAK